MYCCIIHTFFMMLKKIFLKHSSITQHKHKNCVTFQGNRARSLKRVLYEIFIQTKLSFFDNIIIIMNIKNYTDYFS